MLSRNVSVAYFFLGFVYLFYSLGLFLIIFSINIFVGLQLMASLGWLVSVLFFLFFIVSWPIGTIFSSKSIRAGSAVLMIAGIFNALVGYGFIMYSGINFLLFGLMGAFLIPFLIFILFLGFILIGYGYWDIGSKLNDKLLKIGAYLLILGGFLPVLSPIGLILVGYTFRNYTLGVERLELLDNSSFESP